MIFASTTYATLGHCEHKAEEQPTQTYQYRSICAKIASVTVSSTPGSKDITRTRVSMIGPTLSTLIQPTGKGGV